MGLYTETDIYAPARSLALLCIRLLRNLPRDLQRSLGDEVRLHAVMIVILILRANIARGRAKVPHLEELLERLEILKLDLRFAEELEVLATHHHAETIHLTDDIGKQAMGWKQWALEAPVS